MDYHRSMSSVHFLQRRAIHLSNSFGRDSDYLPRDFLLNNVSSNTVAWDNCSMESAIDEAEVFPFALQFTSVARNGHLIAVGGEDGLTAFVDSRIDDSVVHRFYSHSNAIFDVLWNKNDSELITASGDRTVKVWDSATTELKNTLIGHSGSVKNVTGNPMNQNLLGSCSRDGSIMVFDTRSKNDGKGGSIVFKAEQAHSLRKTMIKRRRIGLDFGCSGTVSSVKFANDGYTLLSAGASDGLVKFWDIRFSKNNKKVLSRASFNPCERSGCSRQHGITSIDVSRDGGKLMVSSCNDTIYIYSMSSIGQEDCQMLRGHRTHSFYVKARFTADGEYAICGSSDSNAYLWNLQGGMNSYRLPVKVLEGHLSEINGVDSCQTEFGKYATCSDDGAIKVWRIQR